MKKVNVSLLLTLLSSMIFCDGLTAQTWTGAGSDDFWFNTDNWNGGVVPNSSTAIVTINSPSPTNLDSDVIVRSLNIGSSGCLHLNPDGGFPGPVLEFQSSPSVSFSNSGDIVLRRNSIIEVRNSINNAGLIELGENSGTGRMRLMTPTVTLNSGGTLDILGNSSILNSTSNQTLDIANQLVTGNGRIGTGLTSSVRILIGNNSEITEGVDLSPGNGGIENHGLIDATMGDMNIDGNGSSTPMVIDNEFGMIMASGSQGRIRFGDRVDIEKGTIRTTGSGLIQVANSSKTKFIDLNSLGRFEVTGSLAELILEGTIENSGTYKAISNADIGISGDVTLFGGGSVNLDSSGINSQIRRFGSGSAILRLEGHKIEGRGSIGNNTVEIVIDSNSIVEVSSQFSGQRLKVDPSPAGLTNHGIMQSLNSSSVLELSGAGGGSFSNQNGIIRTVGNNRIIELTDNAEVVGGIICEASSGGRLRIPANESAALQNVDVDLDIDIFAGATLFVDESIINRQVLTVDGRLSDAILLFDNGAEIESGVGTINLLSDIGTATINGGANARIDGNRLTGLGEINVNTTFVGGAKISPGSPLGELTFNSSPTFSDNTRLEIDLVSAIGAPGVDWDHLAINGTLNLTGPTVIALNTLDSLGGNAALMNFDDTLSFNWPIVSADSITGFDTSNFTFDTSSFANVFSGTFSVALLMLQGQQAVVLNYTPSTVALGDVNLDGLVNLLDIQPFVALLTNGQFQSEADINQDGLVNLLDIEGFVDLLSGG